MSTIGQPERATQNRVIALFRDELKYDFLGDWRDRAFNSNIEEGLLTDYLARNGYTDVQISGALEELRRAADNHARGLYEHNKAVYSLLRYGVKVQAAADEHHANVQLINWGAPTENDFAIAEEVTLSGRHERRPDIVLYVNGIAVGVLELKNSRTSIGDGSGLPSSWAPPRGASTGGPVGRGAAKRGDAAPCAQFPGQRYFLFLGLTPLASSLLHVAVPSW